MDFLSKLDNLNIKYNAMITDSAAQNQAARLILIFKLIKIIYLLYNLIIFFYFIENV